MVERLRAYAVEAGRDPGDIGIEGRVSVAGRGPDEYMSVVKAWRDLGSTHLSVDTMGGGLSSPDGHIDAIRRFKEAVSAT
jgi:hypothetical protein